MTSACEWIRSERQTKARPASLSSGLLPSVRRPSSTTASFRASWRSLLGCRHSEGLDHARQGITGSGRSSNCRETTSRLNNTTIKARAKYKTAVQTCPQDYPYWLQADTANGVLYHRRPLPRRYAAPSAVGNGRIPAPFRNAQRCRPRLFVGGGFR
jgi:hypothetical protein